MVVVQVLVEIILEMLADLVVVVMVDILVEVDLLHIHQHRVMPEEQEMVGDPVMAVAVAVVLEVPDKLRKMIQQQTLQDLVDWVLNFQQHLEIPYQE
jgi:hypothetical protein